MFDRASLMLVNGLCATTPNHFPNHTPPCSVTPLLCRYVFTLFVQFILLCRVTSVQEHVDSDIMTAAEERTVTGVRHIE